MLTRPGILEILQSCRKGEAEAGNDPLLLYSSARFLNETIAAGQEFDTLQRIVLVVIHGRCGWMFGLVLSCFHLTRAEAWKIGTATEDNFVDRYRECLNSSSGRYEYKNTVLEYCSSFMR